MQMQMSAEIECIADKNSGVYLALYNNNFNTTPGYVRYDENVIRIAESFFSDRNNMKNLQHVLRRSRMQGDTAAVATKSRASSNITLARKGMGGGQHTRSRNKNALAAEEDVSLSLMEFAFNRYGALSSNIDMIDIYSNCICSKGKKLFDAFKRKESYNVLMNGVKIQTNLAQIRWTMFACKHGLFDFLRSNMRQVKRAFERSRAVDRRKKKRPCPDNRHSDHSNAVSRDENKRRKGRRRREKTACVGAQNVMM